MARVELASQAWGWVTDTAGNGQPSATVTLTNLDASPATHWSAITGGSSSTGALTTNSDGTLPRYIESGTYNMTVGAVTRRVEAASADKSVFKDTDARIDAKVAFGAAVSANMLLRLGSGTGSLADNATDGPMGLKVKFDSASGDEPSTPIQSNLNIVQGSAAGDVHGIVSRIDVNDASANAGDTVALWGDIFVEVDSGRPTWGLNTYVAIETGSGYTEAAVGAEIGVRNNDTPNVGGIMHLVSHGTSGVAFGVLMGGASGVYNVGTNILMSSGAMGPDDYAIWYGTVNAGNAPSGDPLFAVDELGAVTTGPLATFGWTLGTAADAIQVQRSSVAFPRAKINTDGRYFSGSGSATPDVSWGRGGANIFTVGLVASGAMEISTAALAAGAASAFLGMWELASDATAPAANGVRIYAKDNGAGKTQLVARFPTGVVQQLAIEP